MGSDSRNNISGSGEYASDEYDGGENTGCVDGMDGNVRARWLAHLDKIVEPVLLNLSRGKLREVFPFSFHADRSEKFALLEAFGRTMTGIAPWLELEGLTGEELKLQDKYRTLVYQCLANAVDPGSSDYMNFRTGGQPLVDAAFLSHAIVRAPKVLGEKLPEQVKRNLITELKGSRAITPGSSNWLFFSAMVETALYVLGDASYDMMRIMYALRAFCDWYKGDGIYGDGANFHFDYYNSFVIHPMYVDILDTFYKDSEEIQKIRDIELVRAARYASILEKMIGPDGSYPIVGRSICYRFGAFHLLSQMTLEHRLEAHLKPAGVRDALTAVMERIMEAPDMFDENGFLRPGVYGYQPDLAEEYINVGSLYLCTAVFLPLGLPETDAFWSGAKEDWTSRKVYGGMNVMRDHAL